MRIGLTVFGFALLAMIVAACGSDTASIPSTSIPEPSPTNTAANESDFERILRLIPDTPDSRARTRINRVAAIAEAHGLSMPTQDKGREDLQDFLVQFRLESNKTGLFIRGDEWLTGFTDYATVMPDFKSSLGFDTRDIAVSAVVGESVASNIWPPLEVMVGQIDSDLADRLLTECQGCLDPPEIVEFSGDRYYTWGEDFIGDTRSRFALPAFDFLGRGGRLYFGDGFAGRSLQTAQIEKFVELNSGNSDTGASLAEKENWSFAAAALEEMGALSAVFTEQADNRISEFPDYLHFEERILNLPAATASRYENYGEIIAEVESSSPKLPEPKLIAAGVSFSGSVSSAVIAVIYEDNEAAESAAEALRARSANGLALIPDLTTMRWSELIESSQIDTVGRVVKIRIVPVPREDLQQRIALAPFLTAFTFFTEVPYVSFLLR